MISGKAETQSPLTNILNLDNNKDVNALTSAEVRITKRLCHFISVASPRILFWHRSTDKPYGDPGHDDRR